MAEEATSIERFTAADAWQELVEYSDRTSPAEYPDMALINSEELTSFIDRGRDDGANFCLSHLAILLGELSWEQEDGSETWDGDVSATLYGILEQARVIDPWDNAVARHRVLYEDGTAVLQDRVAQLEEALQPFAKFTVRSAPDDFPITIGSRLAQRQLTAGDVRRAQRALASIAEVQS